MSARERHRAGELPWGWWLRARGDKLEDDDGRTWRTVREAFWQGELGFSSVHFADEQHELMLRVLSAIDSRWLGLAEGRHELFDGDMLFWRFYQCWLSSIGLVGSKEPAVWSSTPLDAGLTPDGRSVLMMLRATREPEWEALPMKDVVDAVVAAGRGVDLDAREAALRTFEDDVGFRRHLFAREGVGTSHLVTLTGLATGPGARMPTRRVTWSISFKDRKTRDDLFAWFAARVDHWDEWGVLAYRKGADAFTRHLLGLIVVSQAEGTFS